MTLALGHTGAAEGTAVRQARRRRRGAAGRRAAWVLMSPFLLLFAGTYVAPICYAVYLSLFSNKVTGLGFGPRKLHFVGLANYTSVVADSAFLHGILRVLLFGVVQVPVMLGLALALALVLDSASAFANRFFRFAFFLPYAIPGVIAAIMWGFLYSPRISPIVALLRHTPFGKVDFLGTHSVLWSIANISTWQWTGYNMLIIFAALQAVPRELFEAARVDGANGWRIARSVKIPLVRSSLILTGVFSIIGTLQLFNEPEVLSAITGNITSTYTPNMMAYTTAFQDYDNNYASAIAVCLAIATALLSFGLLRATWRRGERD